jgi:hypothetical protein
MRKVFTLLAVLAMVSCASATVRVFVTTSSGAGGLENDANHQIPTVSEVYVDGTNLNTYDYYDAYGGPGPLRPGGYPAANSPSGDLTTPVDIAQGDWAYIWLQFQNEPAGAKINGLQITINDTDGGGLAGNIFTTYYELNNMNTLAKKRWDGQATPVNPTEPNVPPPPPPGYPQWHNNPQTMVAITANGIANILGADAPLFWSGSAAGRIALLGAVDAANLNALGSILSIGITNISYANFPTPTVAGGVFHFVPEPTSLLLLGLAGLLIRRR